MKLTTRGELSSQGYEMQQKLMPLIEQVLRYILCTNTCFHTWLFIVYTLVQVQMTTSTRDLDTLPDVGSFTKCVVHSHIV